ncbi:hypothetical protein ACKI2N_004855 [Cupriavidus sp. 30B13]|uniref:hypothetical protein n=1 Tax=Cupriavidus sp. 30B13 TaxID=3384241 RepID=UPI003B8F4168
MLGLVLGLGAGAAWAEPASPAAAEAANCGDLLAIVRDSLDKEAEVSCARGSAAASCGERKRPLQAVTSYIRQRAANGGDDCDTLLEVNRRLRALAPRPEPGEAR